jgi:hypothetical protein
VRSPVQIRAPRFFPANRALFTYRFTVYRSPLKLNEAPGSSGTRQRNTCKDGRSSEHRPQPPGSVRCTSHQRLGPADNPWYPRVRWPCAPARLTVLCPMCAQRDDGHELRELARPSKTGVDGAWRRDPRLARSRCHPVSCGRPVFVSGRSPTAFGTRRRLCTAAKSSAASWCSYAASMNVRRSESWQSSNMRWTARGPRITIRSMFRRAARFASSRMP